MTDSALYRKLIVLLRIESIVYLHVFMYVCYYVFRHVYNLAYQSELPKN